MQTTNSQWQQISVWLKEERGLIQEYEETTFRGGKYVQYFVVITVLQVYIKLNKLYMLSMCCSFINIPQRIYFRKTSFKKKIHYTEIYKF